jgi:hypothetical protein
MAASSHATNLDFSGVRWQKSSFSIGNSNCVEFGAVGEYVAIRDSKHPEQTPLLLTHREIAALVAGAKRGAFDHVG